MTKPFSLTQSEGKFLYNGDLSDTIFSVSQKTLYAEYFLDFGEYAMSPESRSGLDNDYSTFSVEKFNEGRRIINCFETSNFFTCTYNLKGRTWSLYYSLKERKPFVSYCPDCDEMAQKVINNFKAIGVWDDYFISYLDFDTIDRYKKDINAKPSRMREIISSDNINFINSIDLSDNPVLVLYKMR